MSEKTRYASVGEISYERSERIDSPSTSEIKRFVGLEHFDQGNLDIVRFGSCVDLGSTMKKCVAGDTLIARRNVYLNRASRCNFDALCSGDAIVLRENECVVPGFLSILFNSDSFWKFASSNADGTMSKRLSVSHLKSYEFCLPSVENQKKFVDLIWKLENLKTKLVMELENLNLLIKSQFIKMFGDLSINDKSWKSDKLSNVLVIERGGSPRPIDDYITNEETGLNWIKIGDANDNSIYIDSVKEKIKPEGLKKTRRVYPDDLILSNSMSFGKPYILKISGCIHDGWLVLHDENDIFDKIFLCYALGNSSTTKKFKSMARGAVVNNLNKKIVGSLEIILPPRNLQNQFADFVKQVDKSKLDSEFDLINLYQNHYFCNAGVLI